MLEYIIPGVIAFVAVLVTAIVLLCRRYSKRKSANSSENGEESQVPSDSDSSEELQVPSNSEEPRMVIYKGYPSFFIQYLIISGIKSGDDWNKLNEDDKNKYYKDWQFTYIYHSIKQYEENLQDIDTWDGMDMNKKSRMIEYWSLKRGNIIEYLGKNYLISRDINIKDDNNRIPHQFKITLKRTTNAYDWNMSDDEEKNKVFQDWQAIAIRYKKPNLDPDAVQKIIDKNRISLMDWYKIKKNKDEDKYVKLW